MTTLRLALTLLLLNAAACGYSEKNDTLSSLAEDSTPTAEDFQKSLQGTWGRPCLYNSASGYYKENIAFAGSSGSFAIVIKDFFYLDAACTVLSLIKSQSLTVEDMTATGTGWSYSAMIIAQSFTPQTPQSAALLNSNHACGYSQWASGVPVDTSSTNCNSTGTILDTLYLTNGSLFRALDEVVNPNIISGTIAQGSPYTRLF
jgi:hypothetical protein